MVRARRASTTMLLVGAVLAAAAVLPRLAVSDARIAATTSTRALWSASSIDLSTDSRGELLFNADGLYPGLTVTECIEVSFSGSDEPAELTLAGAGRGGTGLEDFVRLVVEPGSGGSFGDCDGFTTSGPALFDGALGDLTRQTASAPLALGNIDASSPRSFRLTAVLLDDDAAQGLATRFALVWEARQ